MNCITYNFFFIFFRKKKWKKKKKKERNYQITPNSRNLINSQMSNKLKLTLCFDPQLFFDVIVSYLWELEVPLDPKAIGKLFWNLLPLVSLPSLNLLALLSFLLKLPAILSRFLANFTANQFFHELLIWILSKIGFLSFIHLPKPFAFPSHLFLFDLTTFIAILALQATKGCQH